MSTPCLSSTRPAFAVLALLLLAGPARGELCTADVTPAATLLLPYFEVDLDDPARANTVFTLRNVSAAPALTHLIFWSDWGAPTIDFDVFLTGYDEVEVDLAEVFAGNIPITADAANDPGDTISPAGLPSWDGSFPLCENVFPFLENPVIRGTALDRLVSGHTGSPVVALGAGRCLGADHGDNVARGYVTIDNVSSCSLVLDPGDPGYFAADSSGIARSVNQLAGEATYSGGGRSHSVPLVGIEADAGFDATSTPTGYTFYGRNVAGAGTDHREPLPTSWSIRFDGSPGTELLVWRDSTVDDLGVGGFDCSSGPDWSPLGDTEVVCFSRENQVEVLCRGADCFPLATQKVPFGAGDLDPAFASGRCVLNLNTTDGPLAGDVDFGAAGNIHQSFVFAAEQLGGTSASGGATALTHACTEASPILCGTVDGDGDGLPDGCDAVFDPLTLVKTGALDLGADATIGPGDAIDYTFEVANRGTSALTGVAVSDPLVAPVVCPSGNPIAMLLPGATETCTGSYAVTAADLFAGQRENSATADSNETQPVTDTVTIVFPDDGDGVDASIENAGPNGGDCNMDGVPDRAQANVTGLPSLEGPYLCLVTATGVGSVSRAPAGVGTALSTRVGETGIVTACTQRNVAVVDPGTLPADGNAAESFHQLRSPLSFELDCPAATATILYFGIEDLSAATYRKLGPTAALPTAHWYTLAAAFGVTEIAGETVATATIELIDGGAGDSDLVANGTIVDPGGAALRVASIPTASPWTLLLIAAFLGAAALVVLRPHR